MQLESNSSQGISGERLLERGGDNPETCWEEA